MRAIDPHVARERLNAAQSLALSLRSSQWKGPVAGPGWRLHVHDGRLFASLSKKHQSARRQPKSGLPLPPSEIFARCGRDSSLLRESTAQVRPLAGHCKRGQRILAQLDVVQCVPRRHVWLARIYEQRTLIIVVRSAMRGRWKPKLAAVAGCDQDEALALLRHAVLNGLENLKRRLVVRAGPLVDRSNLSCKQSRPSALFSY